MVVINAHIVRKRLHSTSLKTPVSWLQAVRRVVLILMILFMEQLAAATLPAGFTETQIASGLVNPTAMEFAPDGRLFVCEQGGTLRVIKSEVLLAQPFVTLTVNSSGERGLLGVTFDPNFVSNQFVYVYYTATTPYIHNRLSKFTASGDTALPGSEVVLLDLDTLVATVHNGGAIHFGLDDKLYVAVGENGDGAKAQSMSNLFGKVLRINSDGTIPSDNPFFGTASGNNRAIWALGLRNPFTFSFQPGTGKLYINDVGASTWEEIDEGLAGANYGWPLVEGTSSDTSFKNPVLEYGHGGGTALGCAITGGAFYNPLTGQFPSSYVGEYFFSDYCSGWIRQLHPPDSTVKVFATGISSPVDLKVSLDGKLYYLAQGVGSNTGVVIKIQYAISPLTPTLSSPADSATGQPTSPLLQWNSVFAALSYRVQLSTDSLFSSTVLDDSTITDTFKQVSSLGFLTKYFWRVNAKNTAGVSTWSSVWQFTTIDNPLAIQLVIFQARLGSRTSVMLEWTTLSEQNNFGFYVERRVADGDQYVSISGLIPGSGTTLEEHNYSWIDSIITPGIYFYRLRQIDASGDVHFSSEIVIDATNPLRVDDGLVIPSSYMLFQNYPNPFNPVTVIHYSLPLRSVVRIAVFNSLGEEVQLLVDEEQSEGEHAITWQPTVATGHYYGRMDAYAVGGTSTFTSAVRKMVFLK